MMYKNSYAENTEKDEKM